MRHRFTQAIFFDVDFTLIYPGPTFQGEGYQAFCARHGMDVDPRSSPAPSSAHHTSSTANRTPFTTRRSSSTTRRTSSRRWAARARTVESCAAEIYQEWAACQHFLLYEDVTHALAALAGQDIRLGLISNTHRCLEAFQAHFELETSSTSRFRRHSTAT